MSTTSYTPGSSNPGVVRSLRRSFQLMRQRRTFLALSLCEVARGLVKVPLFALGLKWLTEGCLAQSGALLLRGLGTLVGAVVFATVTVMLTDYWSLQITARTKSEIRTRLINASLTSDLDRAGVETADLIYTLNSSVTELGQLYRATDAVIGTCGKVAGSLVTGLWLSPALSLLVLGLGLAKLGLDKYLLKPLQGVAAEIKGTESLLVKEIIEYLEGTAFFRIFGSSQRSTAQFAAYGQRFADATMREARLTALVTAVSKGIEFLTMLAILGLGGLAVVRGQMTLGSLTAFISIYDDLVNPYRRIGEFLKDFQTLSISSDRVQSVLASAVPATTTPRAAVVTLGSPFCLVAENLSFAYGGNRPILSNFSFEAPSGALTYVVGRSGAGKTTLFKLLMGLCSPSQGRVGVLHSGSHWVTPAPELFTYVSQDPFLFTGTIRENIAVVDGEADTHRLAEALNKAALADLVAGLPDGVETVLSDGGKQLSGGQRCRIALARAFYHHTPIILLDEVFASLDNNTIELIKRSVSQLCQENRCVVMISHRHEWIEPGARVVEISRYSGE